MTREALEAALAWEWEFVRDVQNSNPNPQIVKAGVDMVHLVFAAARKQLALMAEKCGTCGGSGLVPGYDTAKGAFIVNRPCSTCHGSGKVYPQETVETIVKAIGTVYPSDGRAIAVAVLDALNGDNDG